MLSVLGSYDLARIKSFSTEAMRSLISFLINLKFLPATLCFTELLSDFKGNACQAFLKMQQSLDKPKTYCQNCVKFFCCPVSFEQGHGD